MISKIRFSNPVGTLAFRGLNDKGSKILLQLKRNGTEVGEAVLVKGYQPLKVSL